LFPSVFSFQPLCNTVALFENLNLVGVLDPLFGLHRLNFLSIGETSLSGGIGAGVARLSSLTFFGLYGMEKLTGSIASEIGLLKSLEAFYCTYNGLRGELPSSIGLLTNLQLLSLSQCGYVGTIPPELLKLSALTELSLSYNLFAGFRVLLQFAFFFFFFFFFCELSRRRSSQDLFPISTRCRCCERAICSVRASTCRRRCVCR
jgi:hypothetical protein